MIKNTQIKPVVIFSLPRAGSTLLQRIMAISEDISTTSEPWILLPFLYALKREGVYAEYAHFCVYDALQDLCKEMPNGEEDYFAAVRSAMLQIYGDVSKGDKKYFLDKTPRYALVAKEVIRTFPEGKYIFLWRNPLAIIASIVETFGEGKWMVFHNKIDLYDGMESLIQAFEQNKTQALSIKYEDLVMSTEKVLREIENYLELQENELQMDCLSAVKLKGTMGDPTGVKKYSAGISTQSLGGWKSTINNPWRKYWCRRYLKWVGKDRLSLMGYDLDMLLHDLDNVPNQWGGIASDLVYSIYGLFYCTFEFKILKDKIRVLLNKGLVKKHD